MNRWCAVVIAVTATGMLGCSALEPERVATSDDTAGARTAGAVAATSKGTPSPPPIFQIGDTISMGDLEHKLWGARFSDGDQYLKPAKGTRWLVLDIEVTNRGSRPTAVSSLLMWKLQDQDHRSVDQAFMASLHGHLDGELGVGRAIRGELAFSVSTDHTAWELIFAPGVFQLGQAIYAISARQVATQ